MEEKNRRKVAEASFTHLTSTDDCRRTCIRVGRLGDNELVDGENGMNAAMECVDADVNVKWNGMGSRMQNTLDAGMYSCDISFSASYHANIENMIAEKHIVHMVAGLR